MDPVPGRISLSPSIDLGSETPVEILQAVSADSPFPVPPSGSLPLGGIALSAKDDKPPAFAIPGGSVTLKLSGSARYGAGVYLDSRAAFESLGFGPVPFSFDPTSDAGFLYVVTLAGYEASATASYSHPIGILASTSAAGTVTQSGTFAVIARVARSVGATTALRQTIASWRLPRLIESASDLAPGTWVIAAADGALKIDLGAQVGYDVNLVRQLQILGGSRSFGARIAAALETTLGVSLAGKYLIAVGRPEEAEVLRLQVLRQLQTGLELGVNLTIGISAIAPGDTTDFVKAVLGIYGPQVLTQLGVLREWNRTPTSGEQPIDISKTITRLPEETALDLLSAASGVDSRKQFDTARNIVIKALDQWNQLPPRTSALLWNLFAPDSKSTLQALTAALAPFAVTDDDRVRDALFQTFARPTFAVSIEGRWLESIAVSGVLALAESLSRLRALASATLAIISDGVIPRLHDFLTQHLDLTPIKSASDPGKLDPWLKNRLSDFVGAEVDSTALAGLQQAITLLGSIATQTHAKAANASAELYRLSIAASLERSQTQRAVFDAMFDFAQPQAANLFRAIASDAKLNPLFGENVPGVSLHNAVLTHEIQRSQEVQVHLPFLDTRDQHVNRSLGSVSLEENAGRVLVYQSDASDDVRRDNRFRSELSLFGKVGSKEDLTGAFVSYDWREVHHDLPASDFSACTRLLLGAYLGDQFPDNAAQDDFYRWLTDQVAQRNGKPGTLGDTTISFEVSFPASVLLGWITPRDSAALLAASQAVSRALQHQLRALLPGLFFAELEHLRQNYRAAPLLVWSCLPVATGTAFDGHQITSLNAGNDVYWDWRSPDLLRGMMSHPQTVAQLQAALERAHDRWMAADNAATAAYFVPGQLSTWLQMASSGPGNELLQSLLFTEAELVRGAASALADLQAVRADAVTDPARAIARVADFGAQISSVFHRRLSVYSGPEFWRTFNSFLFAEASRALSSETPVPPVAMLTLLFLKPGHTFALPDFLEGAQPAVSDVLFTQTLVTGSRSGSQAAPLSR